MERMETPPFYRLTRRLQPVTVTSCDTETRDDDGRNASAAAAGQTPSLLATTTTTTTTTSTAATTTQLLDRGQIHTKRHSAEDPAKLTSATELLVLLTQSLCMCVCVCLSVCLTAVVPSIKLTGLCALCVGVIKPVGEVKFC